MKIEDNEVYVWAAVDTESFEVIHVDVSEGRSSLDALLFLREVLRRCHGKPLIKIDRGHWYDWALNKLDCDYEKQTFGRRSLVERWFGILKHRTTLFWHRFPNNSSVQSAQKWLESFASIHNSML
jgi:putative transposase